METNSVYRILDANCNRLREALRVIEEYFRFASMDASRALRLREARHSLENIEALLGERNLLSNRDTATDPFCADAMPQESMRDTPEDVAIANLKRAQEASRVIEEYSKCLPCSEAAVLAKTIRFIIYDIEKLLAE